MKLTRSATKAKAKAKATPKKAARKPAAKTTSKPKAKGKAKPKPKGTAKPKPKARSRSTSKVGRWEKFVEKHGVVLASAKGPVPNIAEEVAGEPIVGSWWSHPRGTQIFDALSSLDDSLDIRCFKLVDGKITFVHRRLWPALAALAKAGVLDAERVTSIQQEHMPTGEHRNIATPFPDWAPEQVLEAADLLDLEAAKAALGDWI